MKVSVNDPLIGPSRITASQVKSWYSDNWGIVPTAVSDYLNEIERLCVLVGFDALLLIAQSVLETSDPDTLKPWTSFWWTYRRNPAGIGITGDQAQNAASQIWANGTDAARGHMVHMCAYAFPGSSWTGVLFNYLGLDTRMQAVYDAGYAGTVRTLNDLTGKWAVDPQYAEKISARANDMMRGMEVQPMEELRIILNPGHRNTSGGNPDEAAFTPQLANAYFDAFSAAGYETVNLGDTSGGLDEACRRMVAQIASASGECVLLDLHLEGGGPPGAFAIIPDVTGLVTNAPVPQDPADTWENNGRDRTLGNEIVAGIVSTTGLTKRQVRLPGLMDESQTGVGGQGYRLATFAYTSPYRAKAVRLVIEHGCHTTEPDRSIIFAPGFAQKCALAAVYAVRAVYGSPGATPVKPKPSVPWDRDEVGPQTISGRIALAFLGEITAKRDVPIRYSASAKSEVFARMKIGDKAVIRGSYRAENGTRWAFVGINGGVGRALLSAFTGPWPTT